MTRTFLAGLFGPLVSLGSVFAQGSLPAILPEQLASPLPINTPAEGGMDQPPAGSGPFIRLLDRNAQVTPCRQGFHHTGGGKISVTQSAQDTVYFAMRGAAVAGAHPCKFSVASLDFDLSQCFEVGMDKPEGKVLKLLVTARVVGLLRSTVVSKGVAEESASASVSCGEMTLAALHPPAHEVSCGKNLSINELDGPAIVPIGPGKYTLHQTFHLAVRHPPHLAICKALSAEFAPQPALNPKWISYWEPFHGADKTDFGLVVMIKVTAD
jgi:hypothetical protein